MSRQVVLLLGAVLWVSFAIVALIHIASGHWMVPLVSVVLVGTAVAVYHARARVFATARRDVEAPD